jgi:hypothetical protein
VKPPHLRGIPVAVSRLVAIGLVIACGCAKKREAPAPAQEPAAASAGSAAAPDPAAVAKEQARAQGVLGPSNQGFGDTGEGGPDLQAKGGGGVAVPVGKLVLGKVELASKGGGEAVTAALTKRLEELEACYQDALGQTPMLAGSLTLAFTLKPDGSFGDVAVQASALKDESLETCLTDSIKAAKLGKPIAKSPMKGTITMTLSAQ